MLTLTTHKLSLVIHVYELMKLIFAILVNNSFKIRCPVFQIVNPLTVIRHSAGHHRFVIPSLYLSVFPHPAIILVEERAVTKEKSISFFAVLSGRCEVGPI